MRVVRENRKIPAAGPWIGKTSLDRRLQVSATHTCDTRARARTHEQEELAVALALVDSLRRRTAAVSTATAAATAAATAGKLPAAVMDNLTRALKSKLAHLMQTSNLHSPPKQSKIKGSMLD